MIEPSKGTYVSCLYTRKTEDKLSLWCSRNGVTNPLPSNNFHTTLLYSRNKLRALYDPLWMENCKVKVTGFDLFPSDKGEEFGSLVLLLNAPELVGYHNYLVTGCGGTHDFPDYTPHVTVTYYANMNTDLTNLELPDFDLEVYGMTICPLDLNWADNAK